MADLVRQGDVRHRGRNMLSVVQQRHYARVQTFQTASVMLK